MCNKDNTDNIENIDESDETNEIETDFDFDDSVEGDSIEVIEDLDFDIIFKSNINKHKIEGTHALKRDTIFMGKLDEEDENSESSYSFDDSNCDIEKGTNYEFESKFQDDYNYKKDLSLDIYTILKSKTDIDFLSNRRKPNRLVFNQYYKLCIEELHKKYSKSEIFVELAYYFTDSIFNMFKMLDKKYATSIILELKEKGYLKSMGNIKFI